MTEEEQNTKLRLVETVARYYWGKTRSDHGLSSPGLRSEARDPRPRILGLAPSHRDVRARQLAHRGPAAVPGMPGGRGRARNRCRPEDVAGTRPRSRVRAGAAAGAVHALRRVHRLKPHIKSLIHVHSPRAGPRWPPWLRCLPTCSCCTPASGRGLWPGLGTRPDLVRDRAAAQRLIGDTRRRGDRAAALARRRHRRPDAPRGRVPGPPGRGARGPDGHRALSHGQPLAPVPGEHRPGTTCTRGCSPPVRMTCTGNYASSFVNRSPPGPAGGDLARVGNWPG